MTKRREVKIAYILNENLIKWLQKNALNNEPVRCINKSSNGFFM